jgi:hypothetical protein
MITFCRTRYQYDSYTDFWKLVQLAGYPTLFVDQIPRDAPGETFVITPINGEWKQGVETSGRVIWWNLEWGLGDGPPPGVDEIWTSDRWHAAQTGARFVPLGSHPALVNVNPASRWNGEAAWDVALLAYMGPARRQTPVNSMKDRGLVMAPNAWGRERDNVLGASRIMVNVHQHDEWPCVPAQRFALAAASAIPLVSETMNDPFPYRPGEDFLTAAYGDIAAVADATIRHKVGRELAGSLFHRACVEYRFDKNVEKALAGAEA